MGVMELHPGAPVHQPVDDTDPYEFDPDKLKADDNTWKRYLFEIFLARDEIGAKYFGGAKYEEKTLEDYNKLKPDQHKAIKEAFMASQKQSQVDKSAQFDDKNKGTFDFIACNLKQGYWNARALTDFAWTKGIHARDEAWKKRENIAAKWKTKGYIMLGTVIGMAHVRIHFPAFIYFLYALSICFYLFLQFKWAKHFFLENGWASWWKDTTVERTFPGSVRYFCIDYHSMMCAIYMWLLLDITGGLKMAWVLLFSAASQLCLAVHCTFASTQQSYAIGFSYIAAALVWTMLWMPSQNIWLKGAEMGPTYKGRGVLATINPNIEFMYKNIMTCAFPLLLEFGAFLYMDTGLGLGWFYLPFCYFIGVATIRHIGFACFLMMGAAKLTANASRAGFDEYGICSMF